MPVGLTLVAAAKKVLGSATLAGSVTKILTVAIPIGVGIALTDGTAVDVPPAILVVKGPAPTPPIIAPPVISPVPPPIQAPSFSLGLNLAGASYYSGERSFSNLLVGSGWVDPGAGWSSLPAEQTDALGNVTTLKSGQLANKLLTPPAGVFSGAGVTILCTWSGTGVLTAAGGIRSAVRTDRSLEFFWMGGNAPQPNVQSWVELRATSPADPVHDLDCREKGAARSDVFAPEFIASLKPFSTIRFLDWQPVNINPTSVTWANRTQAANINQVSENGVALEHMVTLVNQLQADAWFTIPWNANEDYVTRMAQLVHDGMAPNRQVYVEMSNEVWNGAFPVAAQAQKEGLAEGLSDNAFAAQLLRYAEKTRWAMKIWSRVFADRPRQLVRVAATQHANPWTAEMVLGAADTAANVDALATAPYFGHDFFTGARANITDTASLLSILAGGAKEILADQGEQNATIARKYGKRFIAYEAGQHITASTDKLPLLTAVNRANGMYDIYKSYIGDWKTRFNDTMMLYTATGPIGQYGAWGLREYAGQPLDQTPKRRAAIEFKRAPAK